MTKEEQAWLRKLQKVLDACPNRSWGFYTIGAPEITVYDRDTLEASEHFNHADDLVDCIRRAEMADMEISVGSLEFPNDVEGVCG